MKRLICFCAAILLAFPLGGCDSAQTSAEVYLDSGIADSGEGLTLYFEEEEAAAQALEEIYETVDVRGLAFANRDLLKNKFFINPDYLEEFHVKYASGRYGVADVFLLKPYPEYRADVRESLEQVKVSRVKEFENFDIYNSYVNLFFDICIPVSSAFWLLSPETVYRVLPPTPFLFSRVDPLILVCVCPRPCP